MTNNYAGFLWAKTSRGAYLGRNSMMFFGVLFLMFFSSLNMAGQGVTITSTASPGPAAVSPIPITINFKDAVDVLMPADFTVTNGQPLQNLLRTDVNFEYQGKMDLENFPLKITTAELITAFFSDKIDELFTEKLASSVISIDFNGQDELFY